MFVKELIKNRIAESQIRMQKGWQLGYSKNLEIFFMIAGSASELQIRNLFREVEIEHVSDSKSPKIQDKAITFWNQHLKESF